MQTTRVNSKPTPTRHSTPVRLLNRAGRVLAWTGLRLAGLDRETLLSAARRETGLDDFGDESFLEPLDLLLHSLNTEARLNLLGRLSARSELVRLLRNRLRLVHDRRTYPEIANEEILGPIFITGLPRSGTTFLHGLLGQDPANRAPRLWQVREPSPPPAANSGNGEARIARAQRELRWANLLMPEMKRLHLLDANLPEECITITSHSFRSYYFETIYDVEGYRAWHDRESKLPAYEGHRRFLQHLQWQTPGERWVLKAPTHLLALADLFRVYPDARIIMTHRDPVRVLASAASLNFYLRGFAVDRLDKHAYGREVSQRWHEGAQAAIKANQGAVAAKARFHNVLYTDLVREPMAVVRGIYRHFELELTPQAENAMNRFFAHNGQHKHGVHQYAPEDFGLDAETEQRRFRLYSDHFGVPSECAGRG
jgi:hypothetical protein